MRAYWKEADDALEGEQGPGWWWWWVQVSTSERVHHGILVARNHKTRRTIQFQRRDANLSLQSTSEDGEVAAYSICLAPNGVQASAALMIPHAKYCP